MEIGLSLSLTSNKGVGANVWRYANNSLVLKAGGGYWLRY